MVASPIYKAAYTGVLKTLLDLLPHMAFAGEVVLPLLTGADTFVKALNGSQAPAPAPR